MPSKRIIIFLEENNHTGRFNSSSTDKPQPKRTVSYFLKDGVSKKNHKKRKKKDKILEYNKRRSNYAKNLSATGTQNA
jgi:hypothetical protein